MLENLKAIRKQNKLTQQQVAEIIGVDRSSVSYYETGKACPPLTVLVKIAKLYKMSLDELVFGERSKE